MTNSELMKALKKGGQGTPSQPPKPEPTNPSCSAASLGSIIRTGVSFTCDYAFPCLWEAEDPAPADDDDLFLEGEFEGEIEDPDNLRQASRLPIVAPIGPDGTHLVRHP